MKVIVTGAEGFIGKAVCELLAEEDFEIYKIVSPKKKHLENQKTISVDIASIESVREINKIGKVEAFIHCAGLAHQFGDTQKSKFWDVNVKGTENVAKLARELNADQFIHISSVSVYGGSLAKTTQAPRDESSECLPDGFYAQSKLESEAVCKRVFQKSDTKLTILRLATVIGEDDFGNVFRLIKAIDKGKFLWVGKGENKKSLVYKNDVAKAILTVIKRENNQNDTFNFAADPITMSEIVAIISLGLSRKSFPFRIPAKILIGSLSIIYRVTNLGKIKNINKTLRKWLADDVYSGAKFSKAFDFVYETSIREALIKEVKWYLGQK